MLLFNGHFKLKCFDAVCWAAGRASGLKNQVVGCLHGYVSVARCRFADLHMDQLMPLPLTISCSRKYKLVLPFWYQVTWVVPDKGPLNGCCCGYAGCYAVHVCVCDCLILGILSCCGKTVKLNQSVDDGILPTGQRQRNDVINNNDRNNIFLQTFLTVIFTLVCSFQDCVVHIVLSSNKLYT